MSIHRTAKIVRGRLWNTGSCRSCICIMARRKFSYVLLLRAVRVVLKRKRYPDNSLEGIIRLNDLQDDKHLVICLASSTEHWKVIFSIDISSGIYFVLLYSCRIILIIFKMKLISYDHSPVLCLPVCAGLLEIGLCKKLLFYSQNPCCLLVALN